MSQLLEFVHHHPALFIALAVILVLTAANEIFAALTGGPRLSPLDAVRLINDRDPVIVDLRPAADFKRGHILNAINIPAAKIGERRQEIHKGERPVVLYCALGGVAAQASETLRKSGLKEVYPLRGGLNGWTAASLPLTTQ